MRSTKLVLDAAIKLAQDNPDTYYSEGVNGYSYVSGGDSCPNGCLIGQAVLQVYPELRDDLGLRTGIKFSRFCFDLGFDLENITDLCSLQDYQDRGYDWGVCLQLLNGVNQ